MIRQVSGAASSSSAARATTPPSGKTSRRCLVMGEPPEGWCGRPGSPAGFTDGSPEGRERDLQNGLPRTAVRSSISLEYLPQRAQRPRRSFGELIDESPDARPELLDVEVDQQSDVAAGKFQVGGQTGPR